MCSMSCHGECSNPGARAPCRSVGTPDTALSNEACASSHLSSRARCARSGSAMVRRIMPNVPSPLVEFEDVEFSHSADAPIVKRVTLSCTTGHTLAIVGRSGAGKSTMLKLVNRLLLPTSGTVRVQGRDTREWDPIRLRRSIGYVMQDPGLFPHMTVEENVSVVPRLERWDHARATTRAQVLLDLVGLPADTYGARRPSELSGGQRQRVGLARALAIDPPILLMDEPF